MAKGEGFAKELSELMNDGTDTNEALTAGAVETLVGRTVVNVELEVWSSNGETAFTIALDDGSVLCCVGVGTFHGPIVELVRMAGGEPTLEVPDAN